MPLTSILMPLYRPKTAYLEESIASLSEAGVTDVELVIGIDGECSAEALEVLEKASARDDLPRIRILQLPRKGISETLNFLIDNTDSKWIARHDGDDRMMRSRIGMQIESLEAMSSYSFCGTQIIRCNKNMQRLNWQTRRPIEFKSQLVYASLLNNPIAHPTLLMRRSGLGGTRYKEVKGMEDWQLYIDLWQKGERSINLDIVGLMYRVHAEQTTAKKRDYEMMNELQASSAEAARKYIAGGKMISMAQKILQSSRAVERVLEARRILWDG